VAVIYAKKSSDMVSVVSISRERKRTAVQLVAILKNIKLRVLCGKLLDELQKLMME